MGCKSNPPANTRARAQMLSSTFTKIVAVGLSLLLVACSGGGGGGGGGEGDDDNTNYNPFPILSGSYGDDVFTNDTYTDAEVSVDSNGVSIVRTKLAILFTPTATQQEVEALLTRLNATITSAIAGSDSITIRIPDPGTVANLETIMADIESESFVDAVMTSVVSQPEVLPDNVSEGSTDISYIEHHAAVRGTAAWNAKEAIKNTPNIMLVDYLGTGSSPLSNYLDSSLLGSGVVTGASPPWADDHGYHVAGIIAADFGGASTDPGKVTGMFPGRSNMYIIDRANKMGEHDSQAAIILMAQGISGTVVMNTSYGGGPCVSFTLSGTCHERLIAMKRGVKWAKMVRAKGLEQRLFHTKSAGNIHSDTPDLRDTETNHAFATAATMVDMRTLLGTHIPVLTNTMVVERLDRTGNPSRVNCLNVGSFVGGNIGAIGSSVTSLDRNGSTTTLGGTSMAAPQVAGLAAYMLAIDNTLSPQRIKAILRTTGAVVPVGIGGCSDWGTPAPAINAYAAVLALDDESALSGSGSNAPVRNAILDVSNDGTTEGTNDQFDENDLKYFIAKFIEGSQEIQDGNPTVRYSRTDLNGDGYDGGEDGYKVRFNLDINYPPTFTNVTQTIEGEVVEFNEMSLTDTDILCYYAYSDLYTGSDSERKLLMENRCKSSRIAVYYYHSNDYNFPFQPTVCGTNNDDNSNERETLTTRPDATGNTFPERPESHFWTFGDSNTDNLFIDNSVTRGIRDPNNSNNCINQTNFYAYSGINSTLNISDSRNRLNVDITATSESNCQDLDGDPLTAWDCSTATTFTDWVAEYDFKINAALNVKLVLNFMCTGTNRSELTDFFPNPPPPSDLTFSVARLDASNNYVPQHSDPSKWVTAGFFACNDSFPNFNTEELIQFDAPPNGATHRIIIMVQGSAGAFGHLGNDLFLAGQVNQEPPIGTQRNVTTMTGFVEVIPAD